MPGGLTKRQETQYKHEKNFSILLELLTASTQP